MDVVGTDNTIVQAVDAATDVSIAETSIATSDVNTMAINARNSYISDVGSCDAKFFGKVD